MRSSPLFAALPGEELASIAARTADMRLKADEWLIQQGEAANRFVVSAHPRFQKPFAIVEFGPISLRRHAELPACDPNARRGGHPTVSRLRRT